MYIAIDIGGTNARIAGSKSLENVIFVDIKRFELMHNFEKDFQKIVSIIEDISNEEVDAIGIGTPGTYDDDCRHLISAKNIPDWVGVSFVDMLSEKFNCDVLANNDAVVASLGEASYGQGKNREFLYVTWGTGIGGAQVKIIAGNALVEKIDWNVYFKEFDEKCGGSGIIKRFGKTAEELNEKEWGQIMDDFAYYLSDIAEKLGQAEIVLGGGATAKQKERLQIVVTGVLGKKINLSISDLNDDIGLYGGMALINMKEKQL